MGANLPFDLLSKCITTPQAIMTILAYSQPETFLNDNHLQSEIIQPLMALFMVSDKDGVIKKINHLDEIEKLTSFYAMKLALKTGDKLNRTIDYQTSPGMIYLSHSSNEILLLDKERIRSLEKTMFEI